MAEKTQPLTFEKNGALILPVFLNDWEKNQLFKSIDQEVNGMLSKKAKIIRFKGKKGESFGVFGEIGEIGDGEIIVVGLGKKTELTLSDFQKTIAQVLRKIAGMKISSAAILVPDRMGTDAFNLGKLLSEALYLSQYQFDKYKTVDKKEAHKVDDLNIILQPQKGQSSSAFDKEYKRLQDGVEEGRQLSQGVYLARDLVNEPALHLTPKKIAEEAQKIAKNSKEMITIKILDQKECEKLGMNSFLSVARGSDEEPQFIILHYKGKSAAKKKKVCIIGKTIIFDSGGLSLKPSKSMETMKMDMAGGAVVLGVFRVLSNLGDLSNVDVYGILPACENMVSGRASRPGDIVKALNGKTIEILNTDAEGRLALADALSYAEKYIKPDSIVDLATLTGAIMVALGEDITGLFGNNKNLIAAIKKAAEDEHELLWEMPLHKDYMEKMKSSVADMKNISGAGWGGAITASVFLNEFVAKTPWVHLDIAGAAFNEGAAKGITPAGATGWGVKTICRFIQSIKQKK